ncbi:MAG: hypothetical protein WBO19_01935 [Terriglobia bacterium]
MPADRHAWRSLRRFVQGSGHRVDAKMKRLTGKLEEQFAERAKLEAQIRKNLEGLNLAG